MRTILTVVFVSFTMQVLMACSCVGSSFCEKIESYTDDDFDLVFSGTFIQSQVVDGPFVATQFNVTKVYYGEIVTVDSPLYNGEEFLNTETTVWVLSANSGVCMPDITNEAAILAVSYNESDVFSIANEFGYSPKSCSANYFPIASDQSITGWIKNINVVETLAIEDFEDLINNNCNQFFSADTDYYAEDIKIYPQPTTGTILVENMSGLVEWDLKLLNVNGREVKRVNAKLIDLSDVDSGVYFLVFIKDRHRITKKVIKI